MQTENTGKNIVLIKVRKLFPQIMFFQASDIKIQYKKNDILIKTEEQKITHIRWTKILVEHH